MIKAVATRLTISEVPPNEMNGSGTPVTGHDDVTTPMLMNAWITMRKVQPIAGSIPQRRMNFLFRSVEDHTQCLDLGYVPQAC